MGLLMKTICCVQSCVKRRVLPGGGGGGDVWHCKDGTWKAVLTAAYLDLEILPAGIPAADDRHPP